MISQLFTAGPFWSNPLLQSTVCISVGLIASLLLRRRSARAHQVLFLAMTASLAVPAMSMIVRHYELGIFVDKPAITESQLAEIPIVPIITEYEISPLPAIPNAYYPPAIETEYAIPAATVVSEAKAKLPLSTILIWSWIIVSTILAARLFVTFILGLGMLRRAFPLHCDKLDKALLIAKGKLGIDKPVVVLAGSTVSSPVIWCWSRRPALLVPEDAEQFEDGVDWVGMFCHELAHWSRLDHISGLSAELIVCVFPWHPLMWWAKRRLAGLSEQACDDWVVAGSRSPADYAESLLDLSPQGQLSFLPAVVGRKNGLENRVRRIIKDKCGNPHLGLCWAVVVTLITACVTLGAAFAQTRPADIDEVKDEYGELLNEENKNELLEEGQELLAKEQELLAQERELELLKQEQELPAEQKLLEQLVNQLQLKQSKLRKTTESTVQLRLEQLKHLNALAHEQADYQKQAEIIESEIQLLQHATAKAKKHHAEGLPDLAPDRHEHETRQAEVQELLTELRALRAKINNIESLLQATISELYGQTKQHSQFEQTTRSESILRQKLIDRRSELEERKSQLKRQIETAPDRKDAEKLLLELEQIEMEMLDINDRLNAMSQEQRLQYKAKYEARRQWLLGMRQGLEDMAKEIQRRLKDDSIRIDVARHKAELDKIYKRIREIDFELSSPQWCPEKRKAEQLKKPQIPNDVGSLIEKQKSDTSCSSCHADIDHIEVHRKSRDADYVIAELKNREAEWWAELRAFEADIVTAKRIIRDVNAVLENDQAMLKQINQEIKIFTSENGANIGTDISLFNKLKTMEANRDRLAEKIERDKRKLAKYQEELKAAVERRDKYLKYKPPSGTELDYWTTKRKAKAPVKEDQWHTTPPQLPQGRDFRRRQQEIQTTTPPSQQGPSYSPWQLQEKLQSRINQLQDEISRLRSEMTELRKIMKDMVEYEKNRPKPSLFQIDKDPMDIEENRPKKPLPEIHGEPLEPEKIEPEPSEKKPQEDHLDDMPIGPDEIETTEPSPAD